MEEWRGMTSQQMGAMIHDWIKEDGFPIENADIQNTDFSWTVITAKQKIYILKFKNRKDSIVVSGGIVFGENKERILSNSNVGNVFHDITSKYLELGLSYSFQPNSENADLIELSQHIHYDGLNKHELARTISLVRNIIVWTEQKLSKEIHESVDVSNFKSINSPISGGLPFE
jgi:hypothetical protein